MKLFICLSLISLSSCLLFDWDTRLSLLNKTNKRVKYWFEVKSKGDLIPDTIDCQTRDLIPALPDSADILRTQNRWNLTLKNKPDKLLRVYIVNEDTLSKYGLCDVFIKQMFIKRFDLTYDDLEKMNWRIIYDGK